MKTTEVRHYINGTINGDSPPTDELDSSSVNDPRTLRLQRMRESQRKLRSQRREQLEEVKSKNQQLEKQIQELKRQNQNLKRDLNLAIGIFDDEITGQQMEKLIAEADKDFTSCFKPEDIITIEEFVELGGFKNSKTLFTEDGTFILVDIYNKNSTCLNQVLLHNGSIPMKNTPLRFVKTYGLALVKYHLEGLNLVLKGKLPKSWLDENSFLPKGSLSIVDVLRYIDNLPEEKFSGLNIYILTAFMARRSFGTLQGLAMYEYDLIKSIETAETEEYEADFLLGILDTKLCHASNH